MAKDSDKQRVLERRRVELLHAVRHGFAERAVERRVSKLKAAAMAVVKKYRHRGNPCRGFDKDLEWQRIQQYWDSLTTEGVIDIVRRWRDKPKYNDVCRPCRD